MRLQRYPGNPLLLPDPLHPWESLNVYNPTVTEHNGLLHMLYRGQGADRISRLGYAASMDGVKWWRLDRPVLVPDTPYEARGVEDPRVTCLEGRFALVYTAYSPHGVRMALATSQNMIGWLRHGVILPNEDNKNGALFPRRVRGRYCLLHRRYPDIWLAYSDDLLHWDGHTAVLRPRPGSWDSVRVSAAGAPAYTPYGWLLLYNGVAPGKTYRLGAALLDLGDPTIVLKRQEEPLLEPEEPWELLGEEPHLVFSCGWLLREDGSLWVYYGGADRVIALATAEGSEVRGFLGAGDW